MNIIIKLIRFNANSNSNNRKIRLFNNINDKRNHSSNIRMLSYNRNNILSQKKTRTS